MIPSPNVAEDHQTKNATALVRKQAALLFRESESNEVFLQQIETLLKDRSKLEKNIDQFALPFAAEDIAEEVLKMVKKNG